MLRARHLQSLQRHLPSLAPVLAAANTVIAWSVPHASAGRPAEQQPGAELHTAAGPSDDANAVLPVPARQQHASAAAVGSSGWQRRALHTAAAACSADGPKDSAPQQQGQPVQRFNGDAAEEEEDVDDDDAAAMAHIYQAFEELIQAAYELVQEGKPMEAEYILREGAKQAEQILGADSPEVAPLYDQLAMISFFHDRIEEAKEPALRSYQLLKEGEGEESPATAIAGVRYAVLLLASGQPGESLQYFEKALAALDAALEFIRGIEGGTEEEMEEVAMAGGKFEVGKGEALYYRALAQLALSPMEADDVAEFELGMLAGIALLKQHLGAQQPLVGACLREHHRLVEEALTKDQTDAAIRLYEQQIRLHEAYDPESEHVAMLCYQAGTLEYVMGQFEQAAATVEKSLKTVRTNFEGAEDSLLTVKHRLGMVYGALGQHERARAMLQEVARPLAEKLGEDNPISQELNFMRALMDYREEKARGAEADAARLNQLEGDMQAAVTSLAGYGEEHMLVKKAKQMQQEALAA